MNLSDKEQQIVEQFKKILDRTTPLALNDAGQSGLVLFGISVLLNQAHIDRTIFDDVQDFYNMLGIEALKKHHIFPAALQKFRDGILKEEYEEYLKAVEDKDKEKQLDSLIDLIYVAIGTILLHGWDGKEAWRRVHRSNMQKVPGEPGEGKAIAKRTGQVDALKPLGWKHPTFTDLV